MIWGKKGDHKIAAKNWSPKISASSIEENNQILSPLLVISDFEQAAINAAQVEFPDTIHKGCFFHLCQNFWRKI
jgi:hypothetical protein